jgi:hypothetical protein
MISPDTKPGTEVVCIDASPGPYGPSGLCVGCIYTVKSIEQSLSRKPVVLLYEIEPVAAYVAPHGLAHTAFLLSRFRYIDPQVEEMLRSVDRMVDA